MNNKMIYGICVFVGIVIGALGGVFIYQSDRGGDPVVAEYNGKSIRASEVFQNAKTRIFDLEEEIYRTKEQAINEFIDRRIVEVEAKKRNITPEQLLEKEAGGPVAQVTDEDITAFLTTKGLTLKDPRIKKEDIRQWLQYKSTYDRRQTYVSKLRQTSNVKIKVKEPESPRITVAQDDGYASWGNSKAKVTIYEFSDFQCPFCSKAIDAIDRIKKEYGPDQVRIVFRDMPLPMHPRATAASLAAHCAKDQGKFWEMHNALFQNQAKLEDADLKGYAKTLGLDGSKFDECFASKKHLALIEKSKREAETLGIQATPTFVINGVLIQGAVPFERFKEKIDREGKRS